MATPSSTDPRSGGSDRGGRAGRLSGTLEAIRGRYLAPARVIPRSPAAIRQLAGSLLDSYRAADTAQTRPSALGIEVSDACNLACAVCSREIAWDRRGSPFLRLDPFRRIFDPIRPLYLVLSGYGEPLLNRDLPAMVAHASAAGTRVTVITNGTLLDEARARALREAGLAKLKVSLDGAEPDAYAKHRAGGDLHAVLANVERFHRDRSGGWPLLEIQMVLFRENLDQAARLLRLCRDRLPGVQPFFLVMFTYGEQPGFVEKTIPFNDPAGLAAIEEAAALARESGFHRTLGSLEAARRQLTVDLSRAPCYVPWYSSIVSIDGELFPCCYQSIRGVSVGNVLQDGFEAVWNGERMRAFRAGLRERRCGDKVCATCGYQDGPMASAFRLVGGSPRHGGGGG